uniref:Uncharacterized protein n=1 Tax=Plectus sambesii TaxID=2011161 RepID=A0A914VAI9_9BILA
MLRKADALGPGGGARLLDFLNIPPPSHPPDASPTLEHRPLPPQWQPPIPPTPPSPASCMDESQYDEAQPPEPAVRPSKQSGALPGSFHKTPTLPRTVNGYEVSASQMQRDSGGAMAVDWDECRGSLLRENPETGSFYVPTGS